MTTITLLPLLESVRLERRRAVPAHLDLHYISPQLLAASQPVRPDVDAVLGCHSIEIIRRVVALVVFVCLNRLKQVLKQEGKQEYKRCSGRRQRQQRREKYTFVGSTNACLWYSRNFGNNCR